LNSSNIFEGYEIIDLTHPLHPKIPTWNESSGFHFDQKEERISMLSSSGTHIDAPIYFNPKGHTVDTIPLSQLLVPAHVLDLSKTTNADTLISPKDVETYEARHGRIQPNSLVIAYTGWSKYWDNPKKYRNDLRLPGWGIPALKVLLERGIAGVGIDSFGLEPFDDPTYPGHQLLMKANKYIVENLTNCEKLPPKGALVITLPLKVQNGDEAPVRAVALVKKR
jgi:kynurenine formamidase